MSSVVVVVVIFFTLFLFIVFHVPTHAAAAQRTAQMGKLEPASLVPVEPKENNNNIK